MCAGHAPVFAQEAAADEDAPKPLFYPPLPDLPRIQYLASYSFASDVEDKEEQKSGWLSDFVLGEERREADEGPNKPYGVALDNGQIHVVDTRGSGYAVFDLPNKDYRFNIGSGPSSMPKPINIEIDADGRKYIADTVRNQVVVFDEEDRFLQAFGRRGQFRPTDVLVDGDKLFVVDIQEHRVVVLDKDSGEELGSFGSTGSNEERLFQPTNIALGPNGHLYISDTGNFRVLEVTQEGEIVKSYGAGVGRSPGNFARPKGVAVDREGRVYVVDAAYERVQVFDADGRLLMFFGEPGGTHISGLDLPTDIDIDYASVPYFQQYADPEFEVEFIIAVVNQFGMSKVNVFGFGRHKSMSYDEE
jgi:DNA-binding beta-propeller fold protein YncE